MFLYLASLNRPKSTEIERARNTDTRRRKIFAEVFKPIALGHCWRLSRLERERRRTNPANSATKSLTNTSRALTPRDLTYSGESLSRASQFRVKIPGQGRTGLSRRSGLQQWLPIDWADCHAILAALQRVTPGVGGE